MDLSSWYHSGYDDYANIIFSTAKIMAGQADVNVWGINLQSCIELSNTVKHKVVRI